MNSEQRQKVLSMARHKFSLYSLAQLGEEYKRKLLLEEYYIENYALTPAEMLALFETLKEERRCRKPTTNTSAETAGGFGLIEPGLNTPSVNAEATTLPSAKEST